MKPVFSEALEKKIDETLSRYPTKQAALLPVLHLIQSEAGYISVEHERLAAERLGIKPIKVREVVTFYTMFTRTPIGRYHIQVCSNLSCALAGSDGLRDHLQKKLGIRVGETTPDGKYTLTEVECLGACDQAPSMMINFDYYGNLNPGAIDAILEKLP
jgi:NADH-quinone oxidoreductase subunit E